MQYDQIQHALITDVGVRRSHNQDDYAVQLAPDNESFIQNGHIFLVADGMGGHAVGEKASKKAKQEIPHLYLKHASEGPGPALRRAFLEANAVIHAIGQENPEFRGLGTTGTALVIRQDGAWIGHVGDSRVYRLRAGVLEQLSFDHSLVWALAQQQGVDPDELSDVRKNVIIRSLGPDALVKVDVEGPHPILPNDVYLLCSDGLSNPVTNEEIGSIMHALPPAEACKFLVELANLRGGPDNITVIIVQVQPNPNDMASGLVPMTPPPRKPSVVKRLFKKVLSRISWPLAMLILGFLLAVSFILCMVFEWTGGAVLFVLAAICVGIGLIGLGIQSQNAQARDEESDGPAEPRAPNIYRQYRCPIDQAMLDRFVKIDTQLLAHLQGKQWPHDAKAYQAHRDQVEAFLKVNDLPSAFRELCRGLQILGQSFNKHRQKEESFQPKWDGAPAGNA